MASELQTDFLSGQTVYFQVRNSVGKIWNGSSFVTYVTANVNLYAIAATEQGTASGYYAANMPAVIAGVYNIVAKQQAGGSPAETDFTVGTGIVEWDGSNVLSLSGVPTTSSQNNIAASILETDITGTIEGAAAVHSLATAILKLVSSFDAKLGLVYKTDGATVKMTQAVTTDATMVPIRKLGVGS